MLSRTNVDTCPAREVTTGTPRPVELCNIGLCRLIISRETITTDSLQDVSASEMVVPGTYTFAKTEVAKSFEG